MIHQNQGCAFYKANQAWHLPFQTCPRPPTSTSLPPSTLISVNSNSNPWHFHRLDTLLFASVCLCLCVSHPLGQANPACPLEPDLGHLLQEPPLTPQPGLHVPSRNHHLIVCIFPSKPLSSSLTYDSVAPPRPPEAEGSLEAGLSLTGLHIPTVSGPYTDHSVKFCWMPDA